MEFLTVLCSVLFAWVCNLERRLHRVEVKLDNVQHYLGLRGHNPYSPSKE